jgi:hypothetical protein
MADKKNGKIDGLEFDLSVIGMDDLEDFLSSMEKRQFRVAAEVMAKCCVKCPPEWGDKKDPATFYKRPPVGPGAWKQVVTAMTEAVNEAGE